MLANKKISLVVITSTALRHKFLVASLADEFNVLGVVSEEKKPALQTKNITDQIIKSHFEEFKEKERKYFEKYDNLKINDEEILRVPFGATNSQEVFSWIKEKKPDYIILFGSAIIKAPLLEKFENKIINMHLGLSPYYRGAGTNFWPLVYNEPEAIGATIHLAVENVDAGNILGQIRPKIEPGDSCHNLGCKSIITGVELLGRIIVLLAERKLSPKSQNLGVGKVFRVKDTTAEAIVKMRENFRQGMIEKYLKNKSASDSHFPIVGLALL